MELDFRVGDMQAFLCVIISQEIVGLYVRANSHLASGPKHGYLLYIYHHVVAWVQHNGEQHREH